MALSRTTDPDTSREAAAVAEATGTARGQRALCMEWVIRLPGQTAAEIAVAAGLERHTPSRRLPELRGDGRVVNGEKRICNVTGNNSMTWLPTNRGKTQHEMF